MHICCYRVHLQFDSGQECSSGQFFYPILLLFVFMGRYFKNILRSRHSKSADTVLARNITSTRSSSLESEKISIPRDDPTEKASVAGNSAKSDCPTCCCDDPPPQLFQFSCMGIFSEFSENTSVHGMKYVGGRNRSVIERVCFIFAIIVMTVCCSISISNSWRNWQQNPLLIALTERQTPVWEIPFPAVTICAESKADGDLFNLTHAHHLIESGELAKLNMTDLEYLDALTHICIDETPKFNTTVDGENILDKLKAVRGNYTIQDMLSHCNFRTKENSCSMFKPVLTDEGLCFTFNILGRDSIFHDTPLRDEYPDIDSNQTQNWSLDTGYSNLSIDTYPHHVVNAGERGGLSMLMYTDSKDLEFICRGAIQGFKVHLHMPGEIPRVGKQFFRVPLSQEVMVAIKPTIIRASPEVRKYNVHTRQCYFSGERKLKFFQEYTQQNCEVECLSDYTLRKCGCVKFSSPRSYHTLVCNSTQRDCYKHAEDSYLLPTAEEIGDQKEAFRGCKCLPSCTMISYDVEVTQAKMNMYPYEKLWNRSKVHPGQYQYTSRLNLFFKESQFITYKRSELNGVYYFLSSCGGFLGLFMGFSLLSIVEIFYFLTVRVCWSLRKARQSRKKQPAGNKVELLKPC